MSAADGPAQDVRITGGRPTDEEVAALTAVLSVALDELAGDHRRLRPAPSAWERSQRDVRTPLTPGTWNTFGA